MEATGVEAVTSTLMDNSLQKPFDFPDIFLTIQADEK
jgi:hypothetical protein